MAVSLESVELGIVRYLDAWAPATTVSYGDALAHSPQSPGGGDWVSLQSALGIVCKGASQTRAKVAQLRSSPELFAQKLFFEINVTLTGAVF